MKRKMGEMIMKISDRQRIVLQKISEPYSNGKHHPKDAYPGNTLAALERKNLVEFYVHSTFLHGAVRITKQGLENLD